MDPQLLDGYFTNLVYEMTVHRDRSFRGTDGQDALCDGQQILRTYGLVTWLAAFALVWLSVVAMGFWL